MDDLFDAYATSSSDSEPTTTTPITTSSQPTNGTLRAFLTAPSAEAANTQASPQIEALLTSLKKDRKQLVQRVVDEGGGFLGSPQMASLVWVQNSEPKSQLHRDSSAGPLRAKPYSLVSPQITYKTLRGQAVSRGPS
eukprot:Protomagalhaensia_wolfi_Nauph_80__3002@NODE_3076_length_900_cov_5_664344_g2409_i0_p1_GENE_NODE_3076_length_900_cov_5_664344_g2409_i0NODE_3076_length_900_cov_5_664344_g2409_i0_p1_ORF_typecomplete_len147_score24_19DUF5563/PF17718_1/0_53DUF5563/PF17718_1/2_3e02_NODE_3076_length_900_cov_5_664344_g2409_i032442